MIDEEDYEISTPALNEYLTEINADLDFELDLSQELKKSETKKQQHQQLTESLPKHNVKKSNYCLNKIFSYLFYSDLKPFNEFTVLLESDIKHSIEFFINISNRLLSSKNDVFHNLKQMIASNKVYLFISLVTYFSFFNSISTYFIVIFALFLLIIFSFYVILKLSNILVKSSHKLAFDHLTLTKNIIYYLKECELLSLSNRRRIQIESKQNLDEIEIDSMNYPFRRLVFKNLRKHFYKLKYLNELQLNNIDLDLFNCEKESFVCSVNNIELAEVLQMNTENINELNKLSDYFSLNCLKSLSKLNHYLLSESFKLNYFNKINLIVSTDMSLLQKIFNSIKNLFILVRIKLELSQFNNELNELFDICKMIKQSDCKQQTSTKPRETNELEHILTKHVRNTLIDCYRIRNLFKEDDLSKKKEILTYLKHDFEYCDLYFKKLQNKIDPGSINIMMKEQQNILVEENLKVEKSLSDNSISLNGTIDEDEIYEADVIIDSANNNKNDTHEQDYLFLLKEKEANLVNKNLFYELKFALKTKANEWNERERKAKRIDGNMFNAVKYYSDRQQDDDMFSLNNLTGHLLENDALKYKSIIKRKQRFTTEVLINKNNNNNKQKQTDKIDLIQLKASSVNNNLFLSEFMIKRNNFYNNCEKEEDEIVYE